jgi:hypothetical protein
MLEISDTIPLLYHGWKPIPHVCYNCYYSYMRQVQKMVSEGRKEGRAERTERVQLTSGVLWHKCSVVHMLRQEECTYR